MAGQKLNQIGTISRIDVIAATAINTQVLQCKAVRMPICGQANPHST